MKKVVLFCPRLEPDKDYHYFPLSLLSVAAPLVESKIPCKIIDERVNPDYERDLTSEMTGALCFCVTAFTGYQVFRALEVCKKIRKKFPNILIIWGGQHITNLPEQSLKSEFVDIGVIGYGEHIFKELIKRLISDCKIDDLSGIAFKNAEGVVRVNPPQRFKADALSPLPYCLLEIEKYVNPAKKRFLYLSSYGCPGICTFCATKNQKMWFPLPLSRLKKDIKYLLEHHPFKEVVFFDATSFTLPERLLEIAEFIGPYNIRFLVDGRAAETHRLNKGLIRKLLESGLKQVTIGLETGSPKIVDIMRKGKGHLENYETIARMFSGFDILLCSGVVFGVPGEDTSDLKKTIAFIKKIKKINKNFRVSSTFFRPLPGTELYFGLEEKGYSFPKSLREWAEEGERTHYQYNQWMDIPWMDEKGKKEYRRIYAEFIEEEKSIFI